MTLENMYKLFWNALIANANNAKPHNLNVSQ